MKIRNILVVLLVLLVASSYAGFKTYPDPDKIPFYKYSSDRGDYLDDVYDYDVKKYDIYIHPLSYEDPILEGEVFVTAEVTAEIDTLIFDLVDELAISEMSLENITTQSIGQIPLSNIIRLNDRVKIPLDEPLPIGDEIIYQVVYNGESPQDGYFVPYDVTSYQGHPLIATISAPEGAHFWFPCKDLPSDKADEVIMKCKVPSNMKVMSNGLLISEEPSGDEITYVWNETYPIATYLISIAISEYTEVEQTYTSTLSGKEMPILNYVFPEKVEQATEDFAILPEMIDCLEFYYGEYPFIDEKYGHAMFGFNGGMENQTATSIGASQINGTHSAYDLILHELSHQWIGDKITNKTFDDTWLNEGGATWSEALWNEYKYGADSYNSNMNSSYSVAISRTEPLHGFADTYNRFVYDKGAWVYHMLRYVLGDEKYFSALKKYMTESPYIYGAATGEEFISYMGQTAGVDLDWFYDQWITGGGHPHYTFTYDIVNDAESSNLTITVEQTQEQTPDVGIFTMPIPVVVQFADFTSELIYLDNTQQYQTFEFDYNKRLVNYMSIENFNYKDKILCRKELSEKSSYIDLTKERYSFELLENYPNPFNPNTTIQFNLPDEMNVSLSIYNVKGELVENVINGIKEAGNHKINFDGSSYTSGIYYYILNANGKRAVRKMMLVK